MRHELQPSDRHSAFRGAETILAAIVPSLPDSLCHGKSRRGRRAETEEAQPLEDSEKENSGRFGEERGPRSLKPNSLVSQVARARRSVQIRWEESWVGRKEISEVPARQREYLEYAEAHTIQASPAPS
ncbi:MAG: hypothetical protein GY696_35075 [Gammaproteobacteria bacterium]|nr:hypothetical protein [Gammaproteobacteria bacterium]